jgi:translocation and assembly module TamB
VDVSAVSGATPSSRIALHGFVNYTKWDSPRFNLALYAHTFHALDRRTLAALDISTEDSLRLVGSMDDAALTGTLRVDRGEVYLPERDLLRKQIVDLTGDQLYQIIDSTDARTRQIIPNAPSRLVQNLRLQNVKIVLGDEVWLKSREANIKLGGSLNVRTAEKQSSLSVSRKTTRSDSLGLALEGTLTADRGTYTLDLAPAPVQREFAVQSGTITFFGTADDNPDVDITATHAVKRANQPDLIIQVQLKGPLYPNPSITLSSTNEAYLSPSDLISYLVTGQPTYALTSGELGVVQQVSSVVAPTLSALATASLRSTLLGSFVDQFSITSGVAPTFGSSAAQSATLRDYFFGARVGAEKQISNNLFFSVSAGLCSFNRDYAQTNQSQSALGGFVDALGAKVEYRFNPQLSLQAGTDPPTSALYCGRSNFSLGSVVQTPRQFGLSFIQNWHF